MTTFVLVHRHAAPDCDAAFAAWRGHPSRLRSVPALSACVFGIHMVTWTVEAADAGAALALLPAFVAERCEAIAVRPTLLP